MQMRRPTWLPRPPAKSPGATLDPLVLKALQLLSFSHGAPDADLLASQLATQEFVGHAWLEGGTWSWPVVKTAAQAAVRLQAVALTGDEAA